MTYAEICDLLRAERPRSIERAIKMLEKHGCEVARNVVALDARRYVVLTPDPLSDTGISVSKFLI